MRTRRLGCALRLIGATAGLVASMVVPAGAQTTIEYYALDAVGSVRVVFDQAGTVVARRDYEPFGAEVAATGTAPNRLFAGLFRDAEAGLDYAEARSYQVRTGRFNAPDPIYAGLFEPQRWNRYAYALNNGLVYTDADGLNASRCSLEGGRDGYCTTVDAELSRFTVTTISFWFPVGTVYVTPRSSGGGSGTGEPIGGSRGRPVPPSTPAAPPASPPAGTPPTPPTNNPAPGPRPEPESPADGTKEMIREFARGCGEGLAIVADTLNPFGDPFEAAGYYSENTPGYGFSSASAAVSATLLSVASGVRGLAEITRLAPRGSALWKLNNNQYVRVGYSMWPRTQGRIPRIAFGTSHKHNYRLTVCGR